MKRKSAGEKLPGDASETAWPGVASVWQTDYHFERYGALAASNRQEWSYLCYPHTAGVTPVGRMWTLQGQKKRFNPLDVCMNWHEQEHDMNKTESRLTCYIV